MGVVPLISKESDPVRAMNTIMSNIDVLNYDGGFCIHSKKFCSYRNIHAAFIRSEFRTLYDNDWIDVDMSDFKMMMVVARLVEFEFYTNRPILCMIYIE